MSIEIRTYDGSTESLSRFVVNTWLDSYREKMIVPDWTAEYFDWQMTGSDFTDRDLLISAWNGDLLVGTLLAMPFDLWVNGKQLQGAQGSWLAVASEVRRDGVALMMSNEITHRQQERNYYGRLGYAFHGSKQSLGPRFWKAGRTNTKFVRPMYLWARVLNAGAVRQWTNNFAEKIALGLLPSVLYSVPDPSPRVNVRAYEPADLKTCLELINSQAKKADLAILWTEQRLQKQLNSPGLAETLVVERAGCVVGLLNFHLLGLFLHGRITSAIIDIFACDKLTSRETFSLLLASLKRMQALGADLVLMREFAAQPKLALLKARFLPQFADSQLMVNRSFEQNDNLLVKNKKIQILWR